MLLALLLTPATPQLVSAAEMPEGTRRMNARLQQWQATFGDKNPYKNVGLIRTLEERLKVTTAPNDRLVMQMTLISEYLNVGDPEKSLAIVTNLQKELNNSRTAVAPKDRRNIRLLEGLSYLRLGEQENCIGHHNPDSCLIPIRSGGQHARRRGAENAEAVFGELANQRPNELGIRWLLNVAAMTLGRYPDGVPARHRIPESIFKSEAAIPRFAEIGTRLDLDISGLAGGTLAEDFDGDGRIDILLTDWDPMAQCHLYRNLGDGHFEDVTEKALLTGVTGGLNVIQTDYNNDGWLDFYVVRGAWMGELGLLPNSLVKNNGDGTFVDVTEEAGLLAFHPALSAAWFDANNDGWLDLFVGCETLNSGTPHACLFYVNNGNGTFTELAAAAGIDVRSFVRGVTAGDFDNDGWPDLYLSCLGQTNMLFRNLGLAGTNSAARVRFSDAAAVAGVGQPIISFPTWFWDYDNDGWLDIWVSGYGADARAFFDQNIGHFTLGEIVAMKLGQPSKAETPRLYRNNHDGTFADVTR
ncbi:MAG TPA: VCBS repeat-containing protein, partial [Verrucomicrobiae bacterium]|nr:VCBS repeat-containing protein [Verrucomicrobiae bacterium]